MIFVIIPILAVPFEFLHKQFFCYHGVCNWYNPSIKSYYFELANYYYLILYNYITEILVHFMNFYLLFFFKFIDLVDVRSLDKTA